MHSLGVFCSIARAAVFGKNAVRLQSTHPAAGRHVTLWSQGKTHFRNYSQERTKTKSGPFVCYSLPHRTLIKIHGHDTSAFLQGLVTNDMELLKEDDGPRALYSHMLNVQGRTLYDIIIYSLKENPGECSVLLECDVAVKDSILRHLKVYKIRRKVSLSPCPELSLWALLPQDKDKIQEKLKPDITATEKAMVLEVDPRTELMGWRLIVNSKVNPLELIAASQEGYTEDYHRHRYAIGLPEGVKDLPPGVALPLESNLTYMQGISFSKGCYIGQELTARTHHTGVVRKRLMPVSVSVPAEGLEEGLPLLTQAGKPAGKHRAGFGEHGLSLIRLAHAKETLILKASEDTTVTLQASVPDWWPKGTKGK